MKNIKLKTSLSILFSVYLLTGCQGNVSNNTQLNQTKIENAEKVQINKNLSGMVEFPIANSSASQKLSVKAAPADPDQLPKVLESSTVSLMYPSTDAMNPSVTIVTGLTDALGAFSLDLNSNPSFNPPAGAVYTLEAYKRLGIVGTDVIAVRTSVKWTGTAWASITTPGIFINSKTTALSLIASYKAISPNNLIDQINVSSGNSVPASITGATSDLTLKVSRMVELVLFNNYDPVRYIQYMGGDAFSVVNPAAPVPQT